MIYYPFPLVVYVATIQNLLQDGLAHEEYMLQRYLFKLQLKRKREKISEQNFRQLQRKMIAEYSSRRAYLWQWYWRKHTQGFKQWPHATPILDQ